jgi:hypothetical protein
MFAAARTWSVCRLPNSEDLAERLLPELLARRTGERADHPLDAAMATAALLDLDYTGEAVEEDARAAVRSVRPGTPPAADHRSALGIDSDGVVTALAAANVLRTAARSERGLG